MFTFLLIVHALIAAALVTVILMQRSEGGGLGMGSGPSGLMTARGAADFLTRATAVLAGLFVAMAFFLATYASLHNRPGKLDTSLAQQPDAKPITAPTAPGTAGGIPMMGGGTLGGAPGAPAAPGGLTSNALAPASAGLPPIPANAKASAAEAPQAEAHKTRSAPTAASLKTIDTKAASGGGSIGINGVSSQANSGSASHAAAHDISASHAPASVNSATPASAAKANPVPTLSIPAPGAPSSGNNSQP